MRGVKGYTNLQNLLTDYLIFSQKLSTDCNHASRLLIEKGIVRKKQVHTYAYRKNAASSSF